MKALIIGKFLPPHKGHQAMILWAAAQFNQVQVLVGALDQEPIPGSLRQAWLREAFRNLPHVDIDLTLEPLPSAPQADREVSRVWGQFLKRRYPGVDVLVSSEAYGPWVAETMGIAHQFYDPDRKEIPISATQIRRDPWTQWDLILPEARKDLVKKICFYGPESTGKTTMAECFAKEFQTAWVPETARAVLDENGFQLNPQVLDEIGSLHAQKILTAEHQARRWLFVDSDYITTQIYGQHYSGYRIQPTAEILQANTFDHYFLFDIDVPWVPDPQRLEPQQRPFFRDWFQRELDQRGIAYTWVRGSYEERKVEIRKTLEVLNQELIAQKNKP